MAKRHITKHDREVDRKNLSHARGAKKHHKRHEHITKHDREIDRENLEHARHKRHHDPRHVTAHDRKVDRENLEHARRSRHDSRHDSRHESRHESEMNERMGYKRAMAENARAYDMIDSDFGAPALLPQNVIQRYWPMSSHEMGGHERYMPDLFDAANEQMHADDRELKRITGPRKY